MSIGGGREKLRLKKNPSCLEQRSTSLGTLQVKKCLFVWRVFLGILGVSRYRVNNMTNDFKKKVVKY